MRGISAVGTPHAEIAQQSGGERHSAPLRRVASVDRFHDEPEIVDATLVEGRRARPLRRADEREPALRMPPKRPR